MSTTLPPPEDLAHLRAAVPPELLEAAKAAHLRTNAAALATAEAQRAFLAALAGEEAAYEACWRACHPPETS